jgi:hypothetical protein
MGLPVAYFLRYFGRDLIKRLMRWESEKDIGKPTVEKIFTTLLAKL